MVASRTTSGTHRAGFQEESQQTATLVAGYDLSAGCTITNNIALAAPPAFVSTNLDSPDFCRPARRNGDWIAPGHAWTGEDSEYPDWIGAKAPSNSGTLIILR